MMIGRLVLSVVMTGALISTAAALPKRGVTTRELAEQTCYTDATTLCADAVPDEAKVTECMRQKRAQLSPPCRKIFDQGIKD